MPSAIQIDDLRLVSALARSGSLGAAARELLVSQPSASHRLAALERRLGVRLFLRAPSGSTPTPAGVEFAAQADAILAQVEVIPGRALSAAHASTVGFGAIASLAGIVFAALDGVLGDRVLHPEIDHGPALLARVHDRALNGAVVAIAEQAPVPRGVRAVELLRMPLSVVVPSGARGPRSGKRPFAEDDVVFATPDRSGELVHAQLAALGARPRSAATGEAAIRIARARGCAAVVPELVARWLAADDEEVARAPLARTTSLSLVAPASSAAGAFDATSIVESLRDRLRSGG